jgi:hypothetical protein
MSKEYMVRFFAMQILVILLLGINTSSSKERTVFEKEPILILSGIAGNQPGEFGINNVGGDNWPTDFVIDNDNNIWIMDPLNNRVQKFNQNGDVILQFPDKQNTSPVKFHAEHIKCDLKGNIVISCSNGNMVVLNDKGNYRHTFKIPDYNDQNVSINFSINYLNELSYINQDDVIVTMNLNGEILNKKIINASLPLNPVPELSSQYSPYSVYSKQDLNTKSKRNYIFNTDLNKKNADFEIDNSQILTGVNNVEDSGIIKVDASGNYFVLSTFHSSAVDRTNKDGVITYNNNDGRLLQKLKMPSQLSDYQNAFTEYFNIDKEGNLYMMAVVIPEGAKIKDYKFIGGKPFLYVFKWER